MFRQFFTPDHPAQRVLSETQPKGARPSEPQHDGNKRSAQFIKGSVSGGVAAGHRPAFRQMCAAREKFHQFWCVSIRGIRGKFRVSLAYLWLEFYDFG